MRKFSSWEIKSVLYIAEDVLTAWSKAFNHNLSDIIICHVLGPLAYFFGDSGQFFGFVVPILIENISAANAIGARWSGSAICLSRLDDLWFILWMIGFDWLLKMHKRASHAKCHHTTQETILVSILPAVWWDRRTDDGSQDGGVQALCALLQHSDHHHHSSHSLSASSSSRSRIGEKIRSFHNNLLLKIFDSCN